MTRSGNRVFADNGFTLIEILIVVAIIGIIAAVAVPAYTEQVARGKRADGKAFLLDLAARQERFFSQYVTYTNVLGAANCNGQACGLGLGTTNTSPDGHYTAAIAVGGCSAGGGNCRTYTITVSPVAADPKCTAITLDNTGTRSHSGAAQESADCWR